MRRSAPPATASSACSRNCSGPARDAHADLRRDCGLRVTGYDQVATAAGDGQVEADHLHARPRRDAGVDLVTQRPVRPADVGSHVTDRRESGQQRHARVLARQYQLLVHGAAVVHAQVRGVAGPVRQVRVHVDQARQAGVIGQVQHSHMFRNRGAGRDAGNSTTNDHDGRRATGRAGHAVDQRAAPERDGAGVGCQLPRSTSSPVSIDKQQRRAGHDAFHCSELPLTALVTRERAPGRAMVI